MVTKWRKKLDKKFDLIPISRLNIVTVWLLMYKNVHCLPRFLRRDNLMHKFPSSGTNQIYTRALILCRNHNLLMYII